MMVRLPRKRLVGLGVLTGMMIVLLVIVIGTLAYAAFSLEYAPGIEHGSGIVGKPAPRAAYVAVGGAQPTYPLPPAPKPVAVRRAAPAPAPVAAPAVRPPAAPSGRCGGDLPPCWVMMRESRGDPNAHNPTGCSGRGCYGKWQCDPNTCDGTGSEAEQDAEARRVWDNGRGCSHWNAC